MGEAEEGGGESAVGRGLKRGGERLEEEMEGGFGEAEVLNEAGIRVGMRGGEEAVEPGRRRRRGRRIRRNGGGF